MIDIKGPAWMVRGLAWDAFSVFEPVRAELGDALSFLFDVIEKKGGTSISSVQTGVVGNAPP
jgi:hypothetical protein